VSKLLAALLALLSAPAIAMEITGQNCGVAEKGHRVVEDEAGWQALWKELAKTAPKQDFKKEFAVAVFAGTRASGGHKVLIDEPLAEKDALVVRFAVQKPKGMATMQMTTPFAVKTFARSGKRPVRVEERKP
jgi:hypothetical protein